MKASAISIVHSDIQPAGKFTFLDNSSDLGRIMRDEAAHGKDECEHFSGTPLNRWTSENQTGSLDEVRKIHFS